MRRKNQAGRPTVPGYVIEAPGEYSMGPSIGFLKPVTYQQLVDHFGTPLIIPPPEAADGRIQVIWRVLWTDGSANEIYDYKVGPHWLGPMEGTEYAEVTEWDVSGDEKGYKHLLKLFDVQADFAERVANPKRQRRRPNLATEVVMAFVPTVVMSGGELLRAARRRPKSDVRKLEKGRNASVEILISFVVEKVPVAPTREVKKGTREVVDLSEKPKIGSQALKKLSDSTYRKGPLEASTEKYGLIKVTFDSQDNELFGQEGTYRLFGDVSIEREITDSALRRELLPIVQKALSWGTDAWALKPPIKEPDTPSAAPYLESGFWLTTKTRVEYVMSVAWVEFSSPTPEVNPAEIKRRLMR